MQAKEKKICSFTQNKTRLQLLKIYNNNFERIEVPYKGDTLITDHKYQVRLNRKIIKTTLEEYQARKIFAQMVTNTVLQLKIY